MKVYISGKITDNPNYEYEFNYAEQRLKAAGFEVVNPTKIGIKKNWTWEDYMKHGIRELLDCDAIYQIQGWDDSKGAQLEYEIAGKLDYRVIGDYEIYAKTIKV